jgi:hypothetical protein
MAVHIAEITGGLHSQSPQSHTNGGRRKGCDPSQTIVPAARAMRTSNEGSTAAVWCSAGWMWYICAVEALCCAVAVAAAVPVSIVCRRVSGVCSSRPTTPPFVHPIPPGNCDPPRNNNSTPIAFAWSSTTGPEAKRAAPCALRAV